MKMLGHLDVGHNDIGDIGISELVIAVKAHGNIESLDISGNKIGQTSYSV
jgi:hypothetical protein